MKHLNSVMSMPHKVCKRIILMLLLVLPVYMYSFWYFLIRTDEVPDWTDNSVRRILYPTQVAYKIVTSKPFFRGMVVKDIVRDYANEVVVRKLPKPPPKIQKSPFDLVKYELTRTDATKDHHLVRTDRVPDWTDNRVRRILYPTQVVYKHVTSKPFFRGMVVKEIVRDYANPVVVYELPKPQPKTQKPPFDLVKYELIKTDAPKDYQIYRKKEMYNTIPSTAVVTAKTDDQIWSEETYYKKRTSKVNPQSYHFLISEPNICAIKENTKDDIFLLILVVTHHDRFHIRDAIRKTWGSVATSKKWRQFQPMPDAIRIVFLLGKNEFNNLNKMAAIESENYRDIVMGDFPETIINLPEKVLIGVKWMTKFCPKAKYVMKITDEVFVNIPHVLHLLKSKKLNFDHERLMIGASHTRTPVPRQGFMGIAKDDFPFDYFPDHFVGPSFLTTGKIMSELLYLAEYFPKVNTEDAYITGILPKVAGVRLKHLQGFAHWANKRPSPCELFTNHVYAGHRMEPDSMFEIWNQIQDGTACFNPYSEDDFVIPMESINYPYYNR